MWLLLKCSIVSFINNFYATNLMILNPIGGTKSKYLEVRRGQKKKIWNLAAFSGVVNEYDYHLLVSLPEEPL